MTQSGNEDQSTKKDILDLLLLESEAYSRAQDLEKLVDTKSDLSSLPVQPLYVSLKQLPVEQVANILPALSTEQRQILLDMDCWRKDNFDVQNFEFWLRAYAEIKDEQIRLEAVKSEDFALYIKGKFNIHTFDVEDPLYPDHDNYFLTDDQLLLFEFDPDFSYINEVRNLIRNLYDEMGVDAAYAHLFKIVSDSFMVLEEQGYNVKKERLRDFGFVDYYEALGLLSTFTSMDALEKFVLSKAPVTGTIDPLSKNQVLPHGGLLAYRAEMDEIHQELRLLKDEKRSDFLQFNFVRLVNGTLCLADALKEGQLAMTRVGKETKGLLCLALSYIKQTLRGKAPAQGIFEVFNFNDLYKVGHSLIKIPLQKIKKAQKEHGLLEGEGIDQEGNFLGEYWNNFLDLSCQAPASFRPRGAKSSVKVEEMGIYGQWIEQCELLLALIPFMGTMHKAFLDLKKQGLVQDRFYLNYTVAEIDFESIILSSFINHALGHYKDSHQRKMGLTTSELKKFVNLFFVEKNGPTVIKPLTENTVKDSIQSFVRDFGLPEQTSFTVYLHTLLDSHLSGYELSTMEKEEFKHVGGPILLET